MNGKRRKEMLQLVCPSIPDIVLDNHPNLKNCFFYRLVQDFVVDGGGVGCVNL